MDSLIKVENGLADVAMETAPSSEQCSKVIEVKMEGSEEPSASSTPAPTPSERREERERPERRKDRDDDRDRRDRRERDRRDRERDYDRDRDRRDRDRRRDRDGRRSRSPDRRRSRSREHRSSRRRSRSPTAEIVPLHLRPRKLNNWDVPPPGMEGMTALQVKSTGRFPIPSQLLRVPAHGGQFSQSAGQSTGHGSVHPSRHGSIHSTNSDSNFSIPSNIDSRDRQSLREGGMAGSRDSLMRLDSSSGPLTLQRQSRRLYVGNIPPDASEEAILTFVNRCFAQVDIQREPGDPAVAAHVNSERGYAFVEFRTHDEATYAMAFDGVKFNGRTLRIKRPKDYVPDPTEPTIPVINIAAVNVVDSADKIYVGSIPTYLNEEQIQELLRTFGELKSFSLVRDSQTGLSKGFAFCEYVDSALTDVACAGLNGMELGDKKLVVQRAAIGANRQPGPLGAAPGTGSMSSAGASSQFGAVPGITNRTMGLAPSSSIPLNASIVPPDVFEAASRGSARPTHVLLLLNMVALEDIAVDSDYEDVLIDVKEECSKFGEIVDIWIPRPVNGRDAPGVGKIFIKYASRDQAAAAHAELAGRKFAERTVITTFYPVDKFDQKEI